MVNFTYKMTYDNQYQINWHMESKTATTLDLNVHLFKNSVQVHTLDTLRDVTSAFYKRRELTLFCGSGVYILETFRSASSPVA